MNHHSAMRNTMLLAFLLIGAGVLLMIVGHSLPADFHDALRGFVIGLSAVVAVVGVKTWRQAAFLRRLRVSANENNKRSAD